MIKNIRWISLVLGIALLTASCTGSGEGEQIVLRFKPVLGESYPVTMAISSQSKVMGMNSTTDMNMSFAMRPAEENDTQVTMAVNYTAINFDMQTPMGGMRYDSKDTSGPLGLMGEMVKPVFDKMLAGELQISFNRLGMVVATAGVEEMLEGMDGMAGISDQVNAAGQMGIATAVFPDKPLSIGDTWTSSVVNETSVPMVMEATYKLVEIKREVVIIELFGKSSLYQSNEIDPVMAAMFSEVSGEFSGRLTVDRSTGWTRESNVSQNMQMKVLQGGIPITVDVLNEITLSGQQ